ncbi:MAG: hypothetical protein ACREBS_05820 [Nitrososphaerales archaeon]
MTDKQSAEVVTKIRNIVVQKLDEKANLNTPVIFEFGANLEEGARSTNSCVLDFKMNMDTEPAIAKFVIEGSATLMGEEAAIDKLLSVDPETNVPYAFMRIYQTIFSVMFMLAGTIDVPCPSPALLKRAHVKATLSTATEIPQSRP